MENLLLTQDFASLQNENEKPVSGLLPVQFVSVTLLWYMMTLARKHISINSILFDNNKHHYRN